MSYILDALRRSQAERERGQVPGLDARPAAVAAVPTGATGQRWRRAAVMSALALVLVPALAWLAWWWRAASPPAPVASAVRAPVPAPAPQPGPEPRPDRVVVPAPPPMPIVVSAPPAPPAAISSAAPLPQGPAATSAPGAAAATTPSRLPAAAPAAAPAPVPMSALTPAQRRDLPPLAMGGSIWSDNALSRFVMVNGQVVREGEAAAPGVVVERIEPKRVLLRWRDLRLEVPL